MSSAAWLSAQVAGFESLRSRRVMEWRGHEMAICEGDETTDPVWRHAEADALQLDPVQIVTDAGPLLIQTVEWDDIHCLYLPEHEIRPQWIEQNELFRDPKALIAIEEPSDRQSIFRSGVIASLPSGVIDEVRGEVLDDPRPCIVGVTLRISGHEVALALGEFHEQADGGVIKAELDESILIQVDGRHPERAWPSVGLDAGPLA